MVIRFGIVHFDITDFALVVVDGKKLWIDKALVRCQIQLLVTRQHLLVNFRIDLYGIAFHQLPGGFSPKAL